MKMGPMWGDVMEFYNKYETELSSLTKLDDCRQFIRNHLLNFLFPKGI